jgi:hypothetical protein
MLASWGRRRVNNVVARCIVRSKLQSAQNTTELHEHDETRYVFACGLMNQTFASCLDPGNGHLTACVGLPVHWW